MELTNLSVDAENLGRIERFLDRLDQLLARFEKERLPAGDSSTHRPDSALPKEEQPRIDRGDLDRLRQDLRQEMQRGFDRIEVLVAGLGIDIEGDE